MRPQSYLALEDGRNADTRLSRATPRRLGRVRRGVSEVIGTILILALTVVLFSSIFYFVSTLPSPPGSSTSQFSAVLGISGGTSPIETNINITYQAGPTLSSAAVAIYLSSNLHGGNFACTRTGTYGNPYTPTQALAGGPSIWTAGQTWTLVLKVGTTVCPGGSLSAAGDNVTVSIVNTGSNTLLFHVVLPGTTPNIPPIFTNYGVFQNNPGNSQPYTVYTSIRSSDLNYNSVYVNSSLWVQSKAQPMQQCASNPNAQYSCSGGSGVWSFTPTFACPTCFPTPQPNTQYTFVISAYDNGTGVPHPQHNSIIFYFTFVGGSSAKAQFAITLTSTPGNPTVSQSTALTSTFTNVGGAQATGVTVNFRSSATGALHSLIHDGSLNVSITNTTTIYWKAGPSTGDYVIWCWVNASGSVTNVATLALTVFPRTLVIDETGVTPGTNASTDTFTYLETDLTSAAVPFNTTIVPPGASVIAWDCSAPTCLNNYDVVIWELSNSGQLTASDQLAIECATGTGSPTCPTGPGHRSVWLVGGSALAGSAATNGALLGDLGLGTITARSLATATNGVVQATLPAQATVPTVGITGTNLYLNGYLPGQSEGGYLAQPNYDTVTAAGGGVTYMTTASGAVAVALNTTGAYKTMTMPFELAALSRSMPWASTTYVTALGNQASVVFDVYNFLANFTTLYPHRSANDWAVSAVNVQPTVLTFNSPAYVNFTVRNNGPATGTCIAELLVNGLPYYVAGTPVTAAVGPAPMGGSVRVTFNWTPNVIGYLSVGVQIIPPSSDSLAANNQMSNSLFARQLYVHYNVLLVDGTQNGVTGASCQGGICHQTTPAVFRDLIVAGFPSSTISLARITTPCGLLPSSVLSALQTAPPRYNLVVWNLGDTINGTSCPLNNRNAIALVSFLNNGGTASSLLFLGGGLLTNVANPVTTHFLGTYLGVLMPTPSALTLTPSGPIYGQSGNMVGNGIAIPYPLNATSYYYQAFNASSSVLWNQFSMYYNNADPWTFNSPPSVAAQDLFSTAAGWHTAFWDFSLAAVGEASGVGQLRTALLQFATFSGRLLPAPNAIVDAPDITFATATSPYMNFDQMHPQLNQQYLVQVNVTNLGGAPAYGASLQVYDGSHILGSGSLTVGPASSTAGGNMSVSVGVLSFPWTPLFGSVNAISVKITSPNTAAIEPGLHQYGVWNLTVYFFYDDGGAGENVWTHQQLSLWQDAQSPACGTPLSGQGIYYYGGNSNIAQEWPQGPQGSIPYTFPGYVPYGVTVSPSYTQGTNYGYYSTGNGASCTDNFYNQDSGVTTFVNGYISGYPNWYPGGGCTNPGVNYWYQQKDLIGNPEGYCAAHWAMDTMGPADTGATGDACYAVVGSTLCASLGILDDFENPNFVSPWTYSSAVTIPSDPGTTAYAQWYQRYDLSASFTGVVVCVEYSTNGGTSWAGTGANAACNAGPGGTVPTPGPGYTGTVPLSNACSSISSFTGSSASGTFGWELEKMDLSQYAGDMVRIGWDYLEGDLASCGGSNPTSPAVGYWANSLDIYTSNGGAVTANDQFGAPAIPPDLWHNVPKSTYSLFTGYGALPTMAQGAWIAAAPNAAGTSLALDANMWDTLATRPIALSNAASATLSFDYVLNRATANGAPAQGLGVFITPVMSNGQTAWIQIWNGGTSGTSSANWNHAGPISLSGYLGEVVELAFVAATNNGPQVYPYNGAMMVTDVTVSGATTVSAIAFSHSAPSSTLTPGLLDQGSTIYPSVTELQARIHFASSARLTALPPSSPSARAATAPRSDPMRKRLRDAAAASLAR